MSVQKSSTPIHTENRVIEFAAWTAGGMVNVLVGQPLDTVKLKVQTFSNFYKSWTQCFGETYRLEGIRGLYSGTIPSLIGSVAENLILFTAYGYCQKSVAVMSGVESTENMTFMQNALSGSMASFCSSLFLCPIELIKCRLQARRELIPDSKSTARSVCCYIAKNEGIGVFTKGMAATMARDVPGYSCFFGAYEATRYILSKKGQLKDDIGLTKTMMAGALGGVAYWTVTFPADVIKSRMQVRGGSYKDMMVEIMEIDGLTGVYKGLTPTLLRTCMVSAALLATYEYTKKLLQTLS